MEEGIAKNNTSKMNPVTHFEMPADDKKRMSQFYEKVFGWKTQMLGEDMQNYVVVSTTETDEKGMIKKPGAINGGFYQRTDDKVSNCPSVVIQVDDIKEHIKKVVSAGGKISGEIAEIPNIGTWASFIDTEGNRVSMIQTYKTM